MSLYIFPTILNFSASNWSIFLKSSIYFKIIFIVFFWLSSFMSFLMNSMYISCNILVICFISIKSHVTFCPLPHLSFLINLANFSSLNMVVRLLAIC